MVTVLGYVRAEKMNWHLAQLANANFTPLIQDLSSRCDSESWKEFALPIHYAMHEKQQQGVLISRQKIMTGRWVRNKTSSCHSTNAKLTMKTTKTDSQYRLCVDSHSGWLLARTQGVVAGEVTKRRHSHTHTHIHSQRPSSNEMPTPQPQIPELI